MRRALRRVLVFCLVGALLPLAALQADIEDGHLALTGEVQSLSGTWLFRPADNPAFASRDQDDADWTRIRLPSSWHQSGFLYDGVAWFRLHLSVSGEPRDLGIMLPYVDAAYEIYVNGHALGGQGRIGPAGELEQSSSRAAFYEVPADVLFNGDNVVALRVRSYGGVGGMVTPDLFVGPAVELRTDFYRYLMGNTVPGAIFLFFGVYHLILFFGRLTERQYLYFGGFGIALSFVVFGLDSMVAWIYDSHAFKHLILHLSLTTLGFWFANYLHAQYRAPRTIVLRAINALTPLFLLALAGSLVSTEIFNYYMRFFLPVLLASLLATFSYGIYLTLRAVKRRNVAARIIVVGFLLFGVAAFFEILGYLHVTQMARFVEEGFMLFVLSMVIAMSVQFSRLHIARERAIRKLARRLLRLNRAKQQIVDSERRYRHLVESTHDLIFALDEEGKFLTVNKAIKSWLGFRKEAVIGQSIADFLFADGKSNTVLRQAIIEDRMKELRSGRKHVEFRAEFRTALDQPRELVLRLARIQQEEGYVIFGIASAVPEDPLMRYVTSEQADFVIGNDMALAELLGQRLTAGLYVFLDPVEVAGIRMGLREIIVNAIEHGNLNITAADKTQALGSGTYRQLFAERLQDDRYADRRVFVSYRLDEKELEVTIRDEGSGFDHGSVMGRDIKDINRENMLHGRGILLTVAQFETVEYRGSGNEVRLVRALPARRIAGFREQDPARPKRIG
ncbi:MAG: ATP-binding protein [Spirochaetales bacterium]|nr:ATP-binding protein [Leptospiraceae bacterium]MCP5481854.1 ATP-binding protein [Spirochaetales bacterium]MCP5486339.1 ATP-binding protein [Spirochaetales bacterium]